MAFPFMKLPRELRDNIYKHALSPPGTIVSLFIDPRNPQKLRGSSTVYDSLESYFLDSKSGAFALNLFLVSHAVYVEARKCHYNNTIYSGSSSAILLFLASRPRESLVEIQKLSIRMNSAFRRLGYVHRERYWSQMSALLSVCTIRYLKCDIAHLHCDTQPTFNALDPPFNRISDTFLSNAPNLHRLQLQYVVITKDEDIPAICEYLQRNLAHLRDSLVKRNMSQSFNSNTGMRFRVRRDRRQGSNTDKSLLSAAFDMDHLGHSSVQQEWKVKVRPDVWCGRCGLFKTSMSILSPCPSCRYKYRDIALDLTLQEKEIDGHVWDSKRWGDSPLKNYLPQNVTIADFERAREHLRAGHLIHADGFLPGRGKPE